MKTAWIAALALLVTGALAQPAGAQTLINGAGATFPYPIYSKWFDEYAKIDPEVRFNYQSIGSGGGIKQISSRTVDFGASDGPMTDEQLKQAPAELLHIPTVLGAVVTTYNLPGSPKLRFAPDVVADIFLGKITKWNDPRITATNPGVTLPDQQILVVHRSDGSGTTYIWVDYLSKVSSEWQQKVGKGTSVNWPVGLGGRGNEGVAGQVKNTPGALGYVELAYAVKNKMPVAAVKNAAGKFVEPTIASTTAAAAGAAKSMPADFRVSLTNAPGEEAYPIASFTWLLVYKDQPNELKGRALAKFLWWMSHEGQKYADDLLYAPLPQPVVTSLLALLIAVPLGVGAAIYLAELAPAWIRPPLAFLVELVAAVPSVIYGLWGIFVLAPLLRTWVQPFLGATLGFLPLFQGPPYGVGMLAAGIILTIMAVPFITAVSREVLLAVPNTQREAALALGATRWETTRMAVLRYGRSGLVGAILLGLGRALGETMAVTMVIGNRPEVALSLFAPGYTMASVIANEFTEATSDLYLSALIEIGLLLFVVTVIVNALARLLVWSVGGPVKTIRE